MWTTCAVGGGASARRLWTAAAGGSGGRSGGRAAAAAAGGQVGGDGGSVTSGLGCGGGAPCLAWGSGCELGDMPPVLGIPLRLGRPRPPTHFRPQPELARRAKGPLLLIEIMNPAINCHEEFVIFTRFRAAAQTRPGITLFVVIHFDRNFRITAWTANRGNTRTRRRMPGSLERLG